MAALVRWQTTETHNRMAMRWLLAPTRAASGLLRSHRPTAKRSDTRTKEIVRAIPGFGNRGLPAILRAAVSASAGHGVRRYCSVRVRAGHQGLLGKPREARLSLAVGNTHSLGDPTHRCRWMRARVGKDPLITPEAALKLVFHEEAGGAHAETERGR